MTQNAADRRKGVITLLEQALRPIAETPDALEGWRFVGLELAHLGLDACFEGRGGRVKVRFTRPGPGRHWMRLDDLSVSLIGNPASEGFPVEPLAAHLARALNGWRVRWPHWAPRPAVMVVSSGVPRSGTAWVKRILRSLIQGAGHSLENTREAPTRSADCDPGGPVCLDDLIADHARSPAYVRLVKVHQFAGSPATQHAAFRTVFTYRDLRDVLVSVFDRTRTPGVYPGFEGWSEAEIFGWLVSSWLPEPYAILEQFAREGPPPGTLLVRYEHLLEHPVDEVERLARFLGMDVPDDFRDFVVDQHSFAREAGRQPGEVMAGRYHRRGIQGGWRDSLTPAQKTDIARSTPELDEILQRLDQRRTSE